MSKGFDEIKDHGFKKVSFHVHGTNEEVDKDCRVDLFRGSVNGCRADWVNIIDDIYNNDEPGMGEGVWMTRSKAGRLGKALIMISKRELPE